MRLATTAVIFGSSLALLLGTSLFTPSVAQACAGGCGGQGGGCGQAAAGGCGGAAKAGKAGGCGGGAAAGCGCGGAVQAAVDRTTYSLPTEVKWQDLAQAASRSSQTGVPMLVYFTFGSRSAHDVQVSTQLFNEPSLTRALNGGGAAIPVLVPLWAMTAQERALGERLNYQQGGLIALVDSQGRVKTSNGGVPLSTRGIPNAAALVNTLQPLLN